MEKVMRVSALGLAALVSLATLTSALAGNECYRRVESPASYRTVAETILVEPERQVAEYVPAVTQAVEERVVVEPAREVMETIPAQYDVVEETVLVSPARRVWQVSDRYGETVGCWVTIPPCYARQARRVLVRPAQYRTVVEPAVTATRLREEIVEPARTVYRTIPARYAERERTVEVAPATAGWAPIGDVCHQGEGDAAVY
jgi:hypothetical protein